jgi:Lanthionine synthetase C-like protein
MIFPEYHTLAKNIEEIINANHFPINLNSLIEEENVLNLIKAEVKLNNQISFLNFDLKQSAQTESEWFTKIKNVWNIEAHNDEESITNFLYQIFKTDEIDLSFPNGLMGLLLGLSKENQIFKNLIVENFLNHATKLLLQKKMMPNAGWQQFSFFPEAFDSDTLTSNNILSWKVGDLHIVKFLYQQAAVNPTLNYALIAENIGMYTTTRILQEQNNITDSSFAKGSTGLVVLYHTLYQETGHYTYLKASMYWLERTKELLIGDFQNNFYGGKESQFLEGLVGVLYVMRALSKEPQNADFEWLG